MGAKIKGLARQETSYSVTLISLVTPQEASSLEMALAGPEIPSLSRMSTRTAVARLTTEGRATRGKRLLIGVSRQERQATPLTPTLPLKTVPPQTTTTADGLKAERIINRVTD